MSSSSISTGDGVYVSRDGKEDRFEFGSVLYYVLNLIIMFYGCAYYFSLIILQNADIPNTYFHAGINGELYTERYISPYHYALMFSSGRLLIFICVCAMVLFRKTRLGCGTRKYGVCTILWSFLLGALVVLDVAALAIFASYYAGCNGAHAKSNPCNDRRWCAVGEVWADANNECPNTGAWAGANAALTLADLGVDGDFQWLLGTSVFFVALEMVFLMLPLALWLRSNSSSSSIEGMAVDMDDVMDPSLVMQTDIIVPDETKGFIKRPLLGRRIKTRR
jgi:hypothetical protein